MFKNKLMAAGLAVAVGFVGVVVGRVTEPPQGITFPAAGSYAWAQVDANVLEESTRNSSEPWEFKVARCQAALVIVANDTLELLGGPHSGYPVVSAIPVDGSETRVWAGSRPKNCAKDLRQTRVATEFWDTPFEGRESFDELSPGVPVEVLKIETRGRWRQVQVRWDDSKAAAWRCPRVPGHAGCVAWIEAGATLEPSITTGN